MSSPCESEVLTREVVERSSQSGEVFDKATVEVRKSQKHANIAYIPRDRPVLHRLYLYQVHGNFTLANYEPQVFNGRPVELALLQLEVKVVALEAFQDFSYNASMLFQGGGKHQDVIQVYGYLPFCYKVREDDIHESLEGGR